MSQDDKVISYISPNEMVALMQETGMITIHETANADGKPVIHAALKVRNAQTGEELPGGLPFSVIMFKSPHDSGFSNIAIGTVVPAAELGISLPAEFFNNCNQRFRFVRAYPLDATSFVLQTDLFVRNATREYVKYGFGVWAAVFAQILFDLISRENRGRDPFAAAVQVYAAAPSDVLQGYTSAVAQSDAVELPPDANVDPVTLDAPIEAEPVPESEPENVSFEPVTEPVLELERGPSAEPPPEASAETDNPASQEACPAQEPASQTTVEATAKAPLSPPANDTPVGTAAGEKTGPAAAHAA